MFRVNVKRAEGFTDREWDLQLKSIDAWVRCWNDPDFQMKVLNYSYELTTCTGSLWWKKCNKKTYYGFRYTNDGTRVVLKKMLSGAEVLKPEEDGVADIELACGNQKGVVGWTYANTLKQWVSRWFISSASIAEQAGNRAHEYMHKLGYDHPFKATADRPYSVPYAVGYLTRDWIKKNL